MPVSRASPASQASNSARRAAVRRSQGDAEADAPGFGTASAGRAGVACSRQLPGRCAEAAPGAAAPGLAREPEFAATAGTDIGTALGLNDPADPSGDGGVVQIGGPLAAAPAETAGPGSAHDEPCAAPEAAGEREPGTGRGDVAAAAGRPPQAAGGASADEPLVFGDDHEDLPATLVAVAGASADPVKDYLRQIGKVPLLNAGQEVELAKQIEAGLFAEQKLAAGRGVLRPGQSRDLERVA